MKKILLISFLSLLTNSIFSQAYLLEWNDTENKYDIKQINLSNNSISNIGTSSTMSSEYDISEIYFDNINNQLVGLFQDNDLWKYNLNTNTDQIVDLGTDSYKDLIVSGKKSFLVKWNNTSRYFELKELNLNNNIITNIGTSSILEDEYDINSIYYDEVNNQILGLYKYNDLWKYNLTINTEQIIDLGNDLYNDFVLSNQKSFLTKRNSVNVTEIKELNLINNSITHIGTLSMLSEHYHLGDLYFDKSNNQIVGLYNFNAYLWKYNLNSNTDEIIDIGSKDSYRVFTLVEQSTTTEIFDAIEIGKKDEIIKIVDVLGIEYTSIEFNKPLIIWYKSGLTKKIYWCE